ncbi:tRNA lysidine(34) synthetase TilS [Acetobacter sp.]|uniref:tRNA lysidine(34) synthetase TilS n=1 Tax=Acetobacter sp. TaxID=440 RepID=UPI0039ED4C66
MAHSVPPAWFVARMAELGPFGPDDPALPPVALAVSGGGDSLCLAWLARHWRTNLRALVVDHGLRADSAQEARLTFDRLTHMGVPARVLTLTDLARGAGMAARARQARYRVLLDACRAEGCVNLLLGHQADDQAETAFMRRRAGSGPDGLAAMGWVTIRGGVRLVRPLLGVSRLALRNTLREAGLAWVDDPSNEDRRAERVRVRHALAASPAHLSPSGLPDEQHKPPGLTPDTHPVAPAAPVAGLAASPGGTALSARGQYWVLAMQAGTRRMARETARAQAFARQVALLPHGWARLGAVLPCPDLMQVLVRCVGGLDYPPPLSSVASLCAHPREATLAGARLVRWRDEWVLIREQADIAPPVAAHDRAMWDNRFRLVLPPAWNTALLGETRPDPMSADPASRDPAPSDLISHALPSSGRVASGRVSASPAPAGQALSNGVSSGPNGVFCNSGGSDASCLSHGVGVCRESVDGLTVGAAGFGLPRAVRAGWPAAFCATLPALRWRGKLVSIPALGWEQAGWEGASALFCPSMAATGGGLYGCRESAPAHYVCPAY